MKDNKELFDYLERIYELQINNQSNAIDSIEAKSGQILTGIGIFLPIALAVITNTQDIVLNDLILIGCTSSFLTIVLSSYVMWAKYFHIRPKICKFYDDTHKIELSQMRKEAILDMNQAVIDNNKSQKWKIIAFNFTIALFCISIIFISLGIIVQSDNFSYNVFNKHTYNHHDKQTR